MSELSTSPASGPSDAIQSETLVRFTPVEPGWVAAYHRVGDTKHQYDVWPVLGYAHWKRTGTDGITSDEVIPCSNLVDMDPDTWGVGAQMYFSRKLFREAQGDGILYLSHAQLMREVSE